jgi:hypothetical protein
MRVTPPLLVHVPQPFFVVSTPCVTALHISRSRVRFPMVSLEFFIDIPYGRTMALGLTQSVIEISTMNIFWGGDEGGRCVGLTNLSPSRADCLEIWEPQPPGTLLACPGL